MSAALDPLPRHLRIPYRRMPVTHRLPHTVPPCTHGFPRNCMQCNLVPHSFQPTTPKRLQPSTPVPRWSAASGPPHPSAYCLGPSAPGARSIPPTIPPGACAIQPTTPKRLQPSAQRPKLLQHPAHHAPRRLQHPNHRTQAPTALARALAASIPLYARLSQPTAQRVTWLPGMGPSCISCIKPRHANYLQCQRYACQAPIALRASTPQARATFRSCAPQSLMTLRASAPWSSTTFHAPRSAPQAPPPHSSQACTSSIRCRTGARQTRGASRHSSDRPSTRALFTLA